MGEPASLAFALRVHANAAQCTHERGARGGVAFTSTDRRHRSDYEDEWF